MKISILLPFKENFSANYAGAVSLFVNDTINQSFYKKSITVFGNTNYKNFLSKSYTNIEFKKKIFSSTNKLYVEKFLNIESKINSDLIEIHNRPSYISIIRKKYHKHLFLFLHNDPLQMNGSRSVDDRIKLLQNVDKIIFNSEWCRNRFFKNFENKSEYLKKTDLCYQSTSKIKIDFKKKKKIISFVGKLNKAKGYDIFGKTIIKILDKYPNWSASVFGDEPREKLIFNHKNLHLFGFKNNQYVLNHLKKVSISIACSRWEEPFGRTSLEAASRGSAVIISNRGGLPETSSVAIKLNELSSKSLFNEIEKLIKNKKKLLFLQQQNYKKFKFTHKYISKILDTIRDQYLIPIPLVKFNVKKNKILKILHLTNFNRRFDGRLQYNTGRRLNNGFVRLGHNVLTLSDRDIIHDNKKILDPTGKKQLQKSIIQNFKNFKPDCLVLGHVDSINNSTISELRNLNKNLRICQWFLDPIHKHGPDYIKNNERISNNLKNIDFTFLTSCPSLLKYKINNSFFIPNPSDTSFEILKNYEVNCPNDIFFAMSHGVHRGVLKDGKYDNREKFIKKLIKKNSKIIFDIYGMDKIQPVWGNNFIEAISKSQMGLNLSRGKPAKYYSSDRIAQLLGNGLLTFIDKETQFDDLIGKDSVIYYSNLDDLSYKINKYKKDTKQAKKIAKKGRDIYIKYFNSTIVSDYMLSKLFDYKSSNNFIWTK
ncbi:glycosyltransferase [Candidatus Pelagibacter ubique]|uniref:glycosyltransferase n=1 Tax=Pelagibacter ubique TaxID=198252 RepID=UPI0003C7ED62